MKNNLSLNYSIDILSHNFIRLGLTGAKALQTVSRFPRDTRRRYAAPKSNAFILRQLLTSWWHNICSDPNSYGKQN